MEKIGADLLYPAAGANGAETDVQCSAELCRLWHTVRGDRRSGRAVGTRTRPHTARSECRWLLRCVGIVASDCACAVLKTSASHTHSLGNALWRVGFSLHIRQVRQIWATRYVGRRPPILKEKRPPTSGRGRIGEGVSKLSSGNSPTPGMLVTRTCSVRNGLQL